MARIRTIKPEFWTDAALIECSLNARLLFIGTWNFADDEGNLDRSAKQIKARIFPADLLDCEPLIRELIAHGLLTEYSVNGKSYLHIHSFKKHQVVNRPGKPQCPLYEDSMKVHGVITEDSGLKGREGKGRDKALREKPQRKKAELRPLPENWTPKPETVSRLSKQYRFTNGDAERYLGAFRDACAAKNYRYADFDAAFSNCVRQDWPKFRAGANTMPAHSGQPRLAI